MVWLITGFKVLNFENESEDGLFRKMCENLFGGTGGQIQRLFCSILAWDWLTVYCLYN